MDIESALSQVVEVLRWPVLALAMLALVAVAVEAGALVVEIAVRRRRTLAILETQLDAACLAIERGDLGAAREALRGASPTVGVAEFYDDLVTQLTRADAAEAVAKRLADFDYRHLKHLERTRILVRFGPALGLMGTLIPLSPALAGLGSGDLALLGEKLQVAFSVTVAGLLVGAVAFAVSLKRDRLYGQDYSDAEYIAARLTSVAARTPDVLGVER